MTGLPAGFVLDPEAGAANGLPDGFVLDQHAAPAGAPSRLGVNAAEGFRGTVVGEASERVRSGQTGSQAGAAALVAANAAEREGSGFGLENVGGQPSPYAGIPIARLRGLGEESLRRGAAASEDFNTRVLPERRAEEAAIGPWNQGSVVDQIVQGGTALLGQLAGSMASPESFVGPAGQAGRMGRMATRDGVEGAGAYVLRQGAESGVPNAVVAGAADPLVQSGEIERGTREAYDPLATAFATALGGVIGTGIPVSVDTARNAYGAIARRRAANGQPSPRVDGSDLNPDEAAEALREFSGHPAAPPAPEAPRALPEPESEYVGRGEVPLRPVQDVPPDAPMALPEPPRLLEGPPDARVAGDVAEPAGVPDMGPGRPLPDRTDANNNNGGGVPGDGEVPGGALRPEPAEVAPPPGFRLDPEPARPDTESLSGTAQPRVEPIADPVVSRETPVGDTQPPLRIPGDTQVPPAGRVATDVVPGRAAEAAPTADARPAGEGPVARDQGETRFTTARGSTYVLHPDGTTTRTKAARAEHPGDSGPKPRSAATWFLSPENANALAPPASSRWRVIDNGDGTISLATQRPGGRWGIAPSQRNIPVETTPRAGMSPFEVWKPEAMPGGRTGYAEVHPGNAIREAANPQQGAPDAAPAAPMPPARSPDTGPTNVQQPSPRAGAEPELTPYRDRDAFSRVRRAGRNAESAVERLTRNGEPAPGTSAARQLEKARAAGEAGRRATYDPEGTRDAQDGARGNAAERAGESGDVPGAIDRGGGSDAPAVPARVLADRAGPVPDARVDDIAPGKVRVDDAPSSPERAADDGAPTGRADTGGEGAPRSDGEAPPLYSTPFDPAAIKRFLIDPITSGVRSLRNSLSSSTAIRTAGNYFRYLTGSVRAGMRALEERYPGVSQIREIADMLATDPGGKRNVKETFQTAAEGRARAMVNRVRNAVGVADDAQWGRIRDLLTGGTTKNADDAVKAQRVRKLLDEQHAYLTEAGVDLGYVEGKFFPRMFDADSATRDQDGFIADATTLYERMGLTAGEARAAAENWLDRLAGVGRGGAEYGHTPMSSTTKGRTLPPEADDIMRKWLVTDPRQALSSYMDRTSRTAEYTRRFGRQGEKFEEMLSAARRGGMTPQDIALMRSYFESATGTVSARTSPPLQTLAGWVQTIGTLSLLPRAVLSSLAEAMAAGSRTGRPMDGLRALADTFNALRNGDRTASAKRTAEMLGIITDAMNDMSIMARMDSGNYTGLQQQLVGGMLRKTGLHALTTAQRVAATRVGEGFIRRLLADAADTTSNTRASTIRLLAELGIDEAQAPSLARWMETDHPVTDMLGDGAEATAYRGALRRFVNETIQSPEAVDRPALASHPMGRMTYGIMSFMYAFSRNVVLRSMKQTQEALSGGGYSLHDRVRMVGPMVGFAALAAAQYGVSWLRENMFNAQDQNERDPWIRTLTSMDRTGAFGTFSPLLNAITSARYNKGLSGFILGPYAGSMVDNLGKITTALVPQTVGGLGSARAPLGPNSPRTNNAEHSAIRAAHAGILAPAIAAALALAPGGAIASAAAGAVTMAATSRTAGRALADTVAGPPTVRARTAGNRNPGRTLGR